MNWFARLFRRPLNPDQASAKVVEEAKKALGGDLAAVLAFGSYAQGEYLEGHSDLNMLVVARRLDESAMLRLAPRVQGWAGIPGLKVLVFALPDLKSFSETFPMEFSDIAESRKCLAGDDPFTKLQVSQARLAFQLDTEIKNLVARMRRRFLQVGGNPEALRGVVIDTTGSIFTLLRAFVRAKKRRPPKQRVRLIEEACRLYRFGRRTLLQAHDLRYGRRNAGRIDAHALFGGLLGELSNMAEAVEKMGPEGPAGDERRPTEGRDEGRSESRGGREEGRREEGGRGRERGRDRDRGRGDRDRDRGNSSGGDRQQKFSHVKQLIMEASQRKKWEPKEPERFVSDEFTRDLALSPSARFGWDRAWQPERRAKGYVPKVEAPELPEKSEQEEFEAAEITAPDIDVNAPPEPELAADAAAEAVDAHGGEEDHDQDALEAEPPMEDGEAQGEEMTKEPHA